MSASRASEAHFQRQVEQLAGFYGWGLRYHTFDSRRSAKGFPDLVLVRPPELLIVELKGERTRVTAEQREWLDALELCGLEVHLWRPSDFDDLHARLARGRHRVEPEYAVADPGAVT